MVLLNSHDDVLEFVPLLQMGSLYSFIYDSENLFADFTYNCSSEEQLTQQMHCTKKEN